MTHNISPHGKIIHFSQPVCFSVCGMLSSVLPCPGDAHEPYLAAPHLCPRSSPLLMDSLPSLGQISTQVMCSFSPECWPFIFLTVTSKCKHRLSTGACPVPQSLSSHSLFHPHTGTPTPDPVDQQCVLRSGYILNYKVL